MSSISSSGGGGGGSVSGVVKFLQGNDSVQVPPSASGIIFSLGTHGINTTGNAGTNTETWALNNAITLGDLSNITGSPAITLTTGDLTVTAGNINLQGTNTVGTIGQITVAGLQGIAFPGVAFSSTPVILIGEGAGNLNLGNSTRTIAIGFNAAHTLTSGNQSTIVGYGAGQSLTSSNNSTFFGYSAGASIQTGSNNSLYGNGAGSSLGSAASGNILVGNMSGSNLSGNNTNNIFLGYGATPLGSSNNAISIGFTNNGASTQTRCFIDGITGTTGVSGTKMCTIDTTGLLGAATLPSIPASSVAFLAVLTSNQIVAATSNDQVGFDNPIYDLGANYSSGSDLFTAPNTALYQFSLSISATPASTTDFVSLSYNGTPIAVNTPTLITAQLGGFALTLNYQMNAGDTMGVFYQNNAGAVTNATIGGQSSPYVTWFTGYQLN